MKILLDDTRLQQNINNEDAVLLNLDAGAKSHLEWQATNDKAHQRKEQGYQLFWNLDLGLFEDGVNLEILKRSIEHFNEVIWNQFSEYSVGVCLYRGSYDLTDQQIEQLDMLAAELQDDADPFLLLDATDSPDPITEAQLTSKIRFPHFTLAVKEGKAPCESYVWKDSVLVSVNEESTIGFSIPEEGNSGLLLKAVETLQKKHISFKLIPEALLTSEWHGLDHMIVDPDTLSVMGSRKLMGFCAAGGTVVTLGKQMGLPLEKSGEEFFPA